jgi:carboxypeptidase Taq
MTILAYEELQAKFERAALVDNAARTLAWDRRTLMPSGSGPTRAKIMSALRSVSVETLCDARVEALLDKAETDELANLTPWQAANLREMRRQWQHVAVVPPKLLNAIAELAGPTENEWERARRENDFPGFVEPLTKYLALQREASQIRGEAIGLTPYDALLDEHEPGMRCEILDPMFDDLAEFLPGLIKRVEAQQKTYRTLPLDGNFPENQQIELCNSLAKRIGFDFARGRIDQSVHPYTSNVPGDIRITTRFRTDDIREGVMATIHECGHAMYEAGLPSDWQFQPVGLARSGSLHESQALIFEMQAGRSGPFLRYLSHQLRQRFDKREPCWSDENVLRNYRRIGAGVNRVEADEVTYPLHIILRYRIERKLISGELNVVDLPEAWNAESRALLGIVPSTNAEGCLQDPHWVIGYIGYFPVYALGALTAAQLFAAARRAEPNLLPALAQGDFSLLRNWTHEHIHRWGSYPKTSEKIIERATGAPLSSAALRAHLTARYLTGSD